MTNASDNDRAVLDLAQEALKRACIALPHLAGIARRLRLEVDSRVPTAGVFESGRLLLNPDWFLARNRAEAAFILAHEMLHLALRTHRRQGDVETALFNVAHDYIINDILVEALEQPVPAEGLAWRGARHLSAEQIVRQIRNGTAPDHRSGGSESHPMRAALRRAGLIPPDEPDEVFRDALSAECERAWFADATPDWQQRRHREITQTLDRLASLKAIERCFSQQPGAGMSGRGRRQVERLTRHNCPPWQMALQRWMETVQPGRRSYLRPNRRSAASSELILPGRTREGWMLHLVLDTSGSMEDTFAAVLGVIASFCDAVQVEQIHVLQCDWEVTRDEYLPPEQLQSYALDGLGGSDMSPAMNRLAEDPQVEAAVILTDGYIDYPPEAPPYAVLWAVIRKEAYSDYPYEEETFHPSYGQVIFIDDL